MIACLLKIILCAAFFLGVYILLLEKQKLPVFNRFYLLFCLLFSFVIPFIHLPASHSVVHSIPVLNTVIAKKDSLAISAFQPENLPVENSFGWYRLLAFVYLVVTFLLLIKFLKNIFHLIHTIKSNPTLLYHHATIVLMPEHTEPHSFLHYIFISKTEFETDAASSEILQHELAHVKQHHTLDILVVEVLCVFFWWHPLLYLYKKVIRLNHEFLADHSVIQTGIDVCQYQLLLLAKASGAPYGILTNHFNYSVTKKRLIMLTKTTSRSAAIGRQVAAVAFIAIATFLVSQRSIAQDSTVKTSENNEKNSGVKTPESDTSYAIWGEPIGYTKEGVTQQMRDEYKTLVNKYLETKANGHKAITSALDPADRKRMETIYKHMSREQQSHEMVSFQKPFPPLKKSTPTQKQFERFKNPKGYGVWINDKKTNNKVLENYVNSDFSWVSVSNLYGAAKRNVSYNQEVNLMTNDYYQKYYKDQMARKNESILVITQHLGKNEAAIMYTGF